MYKYFYIRLFGGLNYFVRHSWAQKEIRVPLFGKPSVKDAIESLGVPHTEFELVTCNGIPVSNNSSVSTGDLLLVYPHFFSLKPDELCHSNESDPKRFVLDVHLGKLAFLLRLFGFDCLYRNNFEDDEIIELALNENRVILSRDLGIFKKSRVRHGYFLRSQDSKVQLREVVDRFNLKPLFNSFSRCVKCNGMLFKVDKSLLLNEIETRTERFYDTFYRCADCNKIYWQGSHYHRMVKFVEEISNN